MLKICDLKLFLDGSTLKFVYRNADAVTEKVIDMCTYLASLETCLNFDNN